MEKHLKTIEKAKQAGLKFAFIPEMDWSDLTLLRKSYTVIQGWNNVYLTGYFPLQFGYLVKL